MNRCREERWGVEATMKVKLDFILNGEKCQIEVDPGRTLLDILRNELHLTGTKEGCGYGECGTCTVLLDGKAVNSCLILAPKVMGCHVTTIEGLEREGRLHPLQEAFIRHGAVQCGFCTPGMILSAKALLDKTPHPTEEEIREAISGNLCRCTGYVQIVEAISDVVRKRERGGRDV
jgi:carbon-monoxide dehydrogenase small subunit